MICYKDRTFCNSKKHKKTCKIRVTEKLIAEAKEFGLPLAVANYCKEIT